MMMDDMPMADDAYNNDAEMMVDYEAFDYEMQEDGIAADQNQIQEYEMDGDVLPEDGDAIVADAEEAPVVDVPIVEERTAPVPAEIPIVAEVIPPQPLLVPSPAPIALALGSPSITQPTYEPQPAAVAPTLDAELAFTAEIPSQPDQSTVQSAVDPQATSIDLPAPPAPEVASEVPAPSAEEAVLQPDASHEEPAASLSTVGATAPVQSPTHEVATLPPEVASTISPVALDLQVPAITLFFDDKSFVLFHSPPSPSAAEAPVVLLTGQPEYFVAPLAEFLRGVKDHESVHFPDIHDCVLGLEHQGLDLCIDENSKYAVTYSLKDICTALIACNQPTLELTLYQITDFEQSLQQRLQGIIPEYTIEVAASEVGLNTAVEVGLNTAAEEAQDVATEAQDADAEGEPEDFGEEAALDAQADYQPEQELEPNATAVAAAETDELKAAPDVAVTEVDPSMAATEPAPQIEEVDERREYEAHDPSQYEDAGEEEQASQHDTVEEHVNAVADPPADGSDSGSGTLESSIHGEDELYEEGSAPPRDTRNLGSTSADGAELHQPERESEFDDAEDELYEEYEDEAASVQGLEPGTDRNAPPHNVTLIADKQSNPDPTTAPHPGEESGEEVSNPPAPTAGAEHADLNEYEYYEDEFEDELDPSADQVDTVDSQQTERIGPAHEDKTPPVEHIRHVITPGKRTFDERDQYEDEYDDGALHESDTKRARVDP